MISSNNVEAVTDDSARKIHSLSFLVPARRYDINFDVIANQALPAILECALMLISQLEQITPAELQNYFGLNSEEKEGLLNEITATGLADLTDEGVLEPTPRLREIQQNQQKITLEEVTNQTQTIVIDNLTDYLQPRSDDKPIRGLPELPFETTKQDVDATAIFTSQFGRFQQATTNHDLKRFGTRLYRVNHSRYVQLTNLPISLDIYAHHDPLLGLRLRSELAGFSDTVKGLITTSGLHGFVNGYLDKPYEEPIQLPLDEYSRIAGDEVLIRYEKNGYLDFQQLLTDRKARRTGYGSKSTRMMIGPLYMKENRSSLFGWLRYIKDDLPLKRALWLPSNSLTWGAQVGLRDFVSDVDKSLSGHGSGIDVIVPASDKRDSFAFEERFKSRIPRLFGLPRAASLDELELFIIPGEPCWAMVQYHARLPEGCGMAGLSLPIGFSTYDPVRVEMLWKLLQSRVGFHVSRIEQILTPRSYDGKLGDLLSAQWPQLIKSDSNRVDGDKPSESLES